MFAHTILSVAHDSFPTPRAATKLLAKSHNTVAALLLAL